jgi:site-specific recombinase XerD
MAKDNFISGCKNSATLETYEDAIQYYMDFLGVGREDYDKLLENENNPKLIQIQIRRYIEHLKKNLSPATISTYFAAVQKFYTMNDVILNWKKIKNFLPEHEKRVEDRPYTHSEIKQLIDHASLRNKALILLMSSTGNSCRSYSLHTN